MKEFFKEKKKAVIICAIVAIIVVVFGAIQLGKNNQANKEIIPTVKVDTVVKQQMVTTVDVDGMVAFKDKMSIYAKNTGKVQTIVTKEGDSIEQGQSIIQYDKSALETLQRQLEEARLSLKSSQLALDGLKMPADESQIKQLESQVISSQKNITDLENGLVQTNKNIEQAEKDFESAKILYNQGAISLTEYNKFDTEYTNLKNQKISSEGSLEAAKQLLESNKAQLEAAKNKNIEASSKNRIESQKVAVQQAQLRVNQLVKDVNKFETSSISPISGTVVKVDVVDGETVTEGKVVAQVGDLNNLIIEAYIPEYDMIGVATGQKVSIKNENTKEEFEGNIIKVYPVAEKRNISGSEKTTVKIEVSIPANTSLQAGFTVKLSITTKVENDALAIPIMAYMTQTDETAYVFVVKEDNTLEKRNIKIKTFKNSLVSVEGLKEGEKIVSAPTDLMQDGMEIIPTEIETAVPKTSPMGF